MYSNYTKIQNGIFSWWENILSITYHHILSDLDMIKYRWSNGKTKNVLIHISLKSKIWGFS